MKKVHISYAGCPPEFPKKVKLAADLLSSKGYLATTGLWNGAESQLLLANEMDPFGGKVARLARQWDVPVLSVDSVGDSQSAKVSFAASVHVIYKAIYEAIAKVEVAQPGLQPAASVAEPEHVKLLSLTEDKVVISLDNLPLIELDYSAGLCQSRDASNLQKAKQALSGDSALRIQPIASTTIKGKHVQLSIENFLFNALLQKHVPVYRQDAALVLHTWPDIRTERFGVEVAQLSAHLMNHPTTINMLQNTYPAALLNAYFWAVHGARLASVSAASTQQNSYEPAESGKVKQALAKLVNWLGGK